MVDYAEQQIRAALAAGKPGRARLWERIRAEVDAAPPLSDVQRDQLRVLLRPDPVPVAPTQSRRIPPRPPKSASDESPVSPLRLPKARGGSPDTTVADPVATEAA